MPACAHAAAVLLLAGNALAEPPLSVDLEQRRARLVQQARRPEAAVGLLGMEELWSFLAAERVREVAELGARRGNHPLIRGVAEEALLRLDLRRGDSEAAKRRRARLGFVESWQIIGPFSDGESLQRAEPVEGQPFAPTASVAGKARAVSWRTLPEIVRSGYVALDAVLRPEQDVCAYATAAVRSPRRQKAAVRAGSSGPLRVWMGADLVLDRRVERPARPDQDAAAVVLERGWNLLRVKSCVRDGGWGFFVRFTDPQGGPLPLTHSADPAVLVAATAGAGGRHRVLTLRAVLEERARLARDDGAARDLADFFLHVSPEDPAGKDAERAQQEAVARRPTADNYYRLALASADLDDRRRALHEAVRLDPGHARALTDLARVLLALGREHDVRAILDRAVAAAPDHLPAQLAHAASLRAAGFALAAAEATRALEAKFPRSVRLLEELVEVEQRDHRPAAAVKLLERALSQSADDASAWRELVELHRTSGDVAGALLACDRLVAARPELLSGYLLMAEVHAVARRWDEALATVRSALAIAPEDPQLHERMGRLLHQAGRSQQAVAALSRSLDVNPQNPELRAYLAHLSPHLESPLDRFRRDPEDVAREAAGRTTKGASATVLWDLHAVQVHPGGQVRTLHQRMVAVLDDRGAREHAEFAIRYTPSRQQVDVRAARVRRGGRVIGNAGRFEQDLSEPWYGLYYDYRALVLRADDLQPGDVVEIEYLVEDSTPHNLLGDYFGDLLFLQESIPRLAAEAVILGPAARPLYFNDLRVPWLTRSVEESAATRAHRFMMRDVPAIKDEPGMPGFSEVAAYLHVSTLQRWSEVAEWYATLVRDQLQSDASIEEAVRRAVEGITDERARVRAVHNLAVQRTRYVGLEFGIHGYQPYRVTDVYARKFGDCKDKAALLLVMMRLIGVEAQMVLVRTRRGGDVADQPASLAIFDHAIAYLPKYDLYLDGTAEFSGTQELPAQDQGVPVLRVAPGEQLRRTPVFPPEASGVQVVLAGGLDGAGGARLHEQLTLKGQAAADWRRHYQSPAQRHDRYEQAWNERHAGARLIGVKMPGVEDLESEVRVEAEVQVPGLGRREGRLLSVPVAVREGELVRTYARQSSRRHDLILDYPWTQDARVDLSAPAGMSVGVLPRPRRIDGPFGRFELDVEQQGARVLSRVRLRIAQRRVPAARYAEFRQFLSEVDEALGQKITFVGD